MDVIILPKSNDIHQVVKHGDIAKLQELLSIGIDVNTRDTQGATPLHLSIPNPGFLRDQFDFLLSRGADINAMDNKGNTPLHLAAYQSFTEIVTVLIDLGANVHSSNNEGRTPLHMAAMRFGSGTDFTTPIGDLLIAQGAEVDAIDNNGYTPLHVAAWHGCYEIVRLLASKGANINAITTADREFSIHYSHLDGGPSHTKKFVPTGITPLGISILIPHTANHIFIAKYLRNKGGIVDSSILDSVPGWIFKEIPRVLFIEKVQPRKFSSKKWWQFWE